MIKLPAYRVSGVSLLLLAALSVEAMADDSSLDATPLNQLQVVGTHNSYAQPIDPQLMALVEPRLKALYEQFSAGAKQLSDAEQALLAEEHPNPMSPAEARAYTHPPLDVQLSSGMRSLEIDLYHDPEGGRFLSPAGYDRLRESGAIDVLPHNRTGLDAPGLKVLHVPDFDFRSHCPTFERCLQDMSDWSRENPRHEPVFVLLELKTRNFPVFENSTSVVPFDRQAFDELDQTVFRVLGRDRVIAPDDVRGDQATLLDAVRSGGWPTLSEARGKFLFMIITAGDLAATNPYFDGAPNLEGRAAFVRAQPGEAHAAFLMLDNALVRRDEIRQRVREGYLVRTRSDIETWEARADDRSRADAALCSGAQIVSTDFFQPGNNFGTSYHVRLPDNASIRMSPAFSNSPCAP